MEVVRERCGIGPDEVSDDRLFSCEEVQCLAACGTAPVAQINWDYHEGLTPERLGAIIDAIKEAGVAPEPLPPSPR